MDEITQVGSSFAAARLIGSEPSWHKLETEQADPHGYILKSATYEKTGLYAPNGMVSPDSMAIMATANLNGETEQFFVTGRVGKVYKIQDFQAAQNHSQALAELGCAPTFACALGDYGRIVLTNEITRFKVLGEDEHIAYIVNVIRADGQGRDSVFLSVIRVVCANTQAMGERDATRRATIHKIGHNSQIDSRVADAYSELTKRDKELGAQYLQVMADAENARKLFEEMAQRRANAGRVEAFANAMFGKPSEEAKLSPQNAKNREVFLDAAPVDGTDYGLFNVITDMNKRLQVRKVKSVVAAQAAQDLVGNGSETRSKALAWLNAPVSA